MDRIVVKYFDGEAHEQYFDDIVEALEVYVNLEKDKSVRACEVFIVTKTTLIGFNR